LPKTIAEVVKEEMLCASTDFNRVKEVEAVIICVPTPLSKNDEVHRPVQSAKAESATAAVLPANAMR
jgi:UDP-N-acetyl-D-mannosaminuronate dehydrogenase